MAQELQEIVEITIDQQTGTIAEPTFTLPCVVSLFAEADIANWPVGVRAVFAAKDQEMADLGFPEDHVARVAFNSLIGQSPNRVEKVLIGREDSTDASMSVTMNAIADSQPEFYMSSYRVARTGVLTTAVDFIEDNSIDIILEAGGNVLYTIPTVSFDTDNSTTYAAIKVAIEATIPGSVATIDATAKTVGVSIKGVAVATISVAVTGGATSEADFDAVFVTDNSVNVAITFGSGTAVDTVVAPFDVPFNADQATTMGDIETAIEAAVTGSVATVSGAQEMTVALPSADRISVIYTVTGGASQAAATYTNVVPTTGAYAADALTVQEEAKLEQLAIWTEANERTAGFVTDKAVASSTPYSTGDKGDIGAYLRTNNLERSIALFDKAEPTSELDVATMGENLPYGPPADGKLNTWAFKTPKGVSAKGYGSAERTNLESKRYTVLTPKAGRDVTLFGVNGIGEPIEGVINRDWSTFIIQRNVFALLANRRAIPLNDGGMLTIIGKIEEAAKEAEDKQAIVPGSTRITYPRYADLPEADRNAGVFSGIEVRVKIQRATKKAKVLYLITV